MFRKRLDYPDLMRVVYDLRGKFRADRMDMSRAGSGYVLFQDQRSTGQPFPIMVQPVGSKEECFNRCLGDVEARLFLLPAEAPWLDEFKRERKAFPHVQRELQIDSFSQIVKYDRHGDHLTATIGPTLNAPDGGHETYTSSEALLHLQLTRINGPRAN